MAVRTAVVRVKGATGSDVKEKKRKKDVNTPWPDSMPPVTKRASDLGKSKADQTHPKEKDAADDVGDDKCNP